MPMMALPIAMPLNLAFTIQAQEICRLGRGQSGARPGSSRIATQLCHAQQSVSERGAVATWSQLSPKLNFGTTSHYRSRF